jgi:hypothetical protein
MKKRKADYIADAVRQKIDANRQRAEEAREREERELLRMLNQTKKEQTK